MNDIRKKRFKKIAESRVNKLLDDFRLLGNCSNKANYEYTEEEIDKIFRTLDKEYSELKIKFNNKGKKEKFKL